ncbi:MAG: UbiD family decarboxylase [Planctomycetota bacterium]|nr:UbiD family decarboxylase [Planctomycetota bacterium]MSR37510.1 UbiD family decarboxylase [Planctomycetota bacterium]
MTSLPEGHGLTDLRALLAVLRKEGQLCTIETEVDPDLEAAEIHRRVIAAGGPALLFQRIKGSPWPVVTNLFGTAQRIELAFGPRPLALVRRIAEAPHTLLPPSLQKLWSQRDLIGALLRTGRKMVRRAPILECIDTPPKLSRLPLLRTWSEDGGPFVTLPLVYTEHPRGLGSNLGMYRIQRFDDDHTGLHMQIGKGGGFHLAEYERMGKPMPVQVMIGGPPALVLSAIAPLPENVPEMLLASLLLGKRLRTAKHQQGPLPVAADCEFCIVGEVVPMARRPEGPFGDHYGYYSLQHDYPLLSAKALLRRKDPILTATVVGKPRQEDFFLGDYLQELLLPLAKLAMPGVQDLWSYGETGYHSLAAAVVQQRYKREAMASAFRILGEGQLSLTKFLLLTDRPVDLRNFRATLEHILARADLRTDLYVFNNLSMDTLDYSGPAVNEGSKGVLLGLGDAIRQLPREFTGTLPQGFTAPQPFCAGCLLLQGPPFTLEKDAPERLAQSAALKDWPLVVLVDDSAQAGKSAINFLWTTFTRFEPAADLHARATTVIQNQTSYTPPIVIDARMKPSYPKELFCDPHTAAKVTRRWREYFPDGKVEMGSSDRAHLD